MKLIVIKLQSKCYDLKLTLFSSCQHNKKNKNKGLHTKYANSILALRFK